MSQIAVIGAQPVVAGFALAGTHVLHAEDADEVRAAWASLPAAVQIVILTPDAADALGEVRTTGTGPLTVVTPL